jgi:serine/threonine-protein kinase RsbW
MYIQETIPSDLAVGKDIEQKVIGMMQDCNEHDVFAVRLALVEAFVDAVKHGNESDPEKKIRVTVHMDDPGEGYGKDGRLSVLRVQIEDEGPGFVPEEVPDPTQPENLENPNGRGLMLMKSYTDNMEYPDEVDGRPVHRGSVVILTKVCLREKIASALRPSATT